MNESEELKGIFAKNMGNIQSPYQGILEVFFDLHRSMNMKRKFMRRKSN